MQTDLEIYGFFSNCAESHINHWNNVVLSGKITHMAFSLGRLLGDVESRFTAHYRVVEKRKFKF